MKTRDIENRDKGRQSRNEGKSERMNPRERNNISNSFEEARKDRAVSDYHSGTTRMNEGEIPERNVVQGEMSNPRAMSPDRSSDWEATNKYGHERRGNPMRNDDKSEKKERFEPGWGNRDYDQDQRSQNIQNSGNVDGGSNRSYPSMSSGYEDRDSSNWETNRESDERRKKGEERKSRRTSDRGRTESDRYEEW